MVGPSAKKISRSGGIHAVELLMLLPIVLALVLGMVELSLILSTDQQLTMASREGARVAAQGGSALEVEAATRVVLGNGSLGKHAVVASHLSDVSGNPVTVSVTVPDAAAVVPNMLIFAAYSIKNRPLSGSTIMRRE